MEMLYICFILCLKSSFEQKNFILTKRMRLVFGTYNLFKGWFSKNVTSAMLKMNTSEIKNYLPGDNIEYQKASLE